MLQHRNTKPVELLRVQRVQLLTSGMSAECIHSEECEGDVELNINCTSINITKGVF